MLPGLVDAIINVVGNQRIVSFSPVQFVMAASGKEIVVPAIAIDLVVAKGVRK
jgi:hypothetical protein